MTAPSPTAKDEAIKTAIRESGEGLADLTSGYGLQSRTFEFTWQSPSISIDLAMPYAHVLSSDEPQHTEKAAIATACRLAILLIEAAAAGTLLTKGATVMTVIYNRLGGPRRPREGVGDETGDAFGTPHGKVEETARGTGNCRGDSQDRVGKIWG